MMNFREYHQDQVLMLPSSLQDLIQPDDPVYVINEAVKRLDFAPFYAAYSHEGNPPYHPIMMAKVTLYAYARGIRSSRKIADLLRHDIRFMYLAAMQTPDFRTIAEFRQRHLKAFQALFVQVVQLCRDLQMIGFQHLAIDGSKVEANAGWKKARSAEKLRQLEREIDAIIAEAEATDRREDELYGADRRGDELPARLTDAKRRKAEIEQLLKRQQEQGSEHTNLTDPDARVMEHYGGKRDWSYNVQAGVDDCRQIIISADVTAETTDHHQLIPLYEQAVENSGGKPAEVSADAGYHTRANYQYLEENQINAYLPDQNLEADRQKADFPFSADKFVYDAASDRFICPRGQRLKLATTRRERGVNIREYHCAACPQCADQKACVKRGKYRCIVRSATDAYQRAMRAKLDSIEGKRKYKRRQATVEPVFGCLKRQLGFTYFLLRGISKVRGEFHLLVCAFNLRKIKLADLRRNKCLAKAPPECGALALV